ncbi:MAG TPA: tetratricopeptide repeat protein, partial [Bryobacteraceae bacterium]|nr:tetratricopeptide repeat protein [Bryobacteraceae bacterium]
MNRRKKRLTIIAVALAVLIVGAGTGYVVLKKLKQQRYLAMRDAGQAAFVDGDYETAIEKLRPYCGRNPTDADTLFQLAEARRRVEAPNGRHLVESLGLYRRFLQLRPERVDVLREVMRLHWQLGYRVEAVDAAMKLMEAMPGDPEAVLTRARGLVALRKNTEAITLLEAAVKKAPLDAELQLLLIRLYHDENRKDAALPYAQGVWQAHRDDGRAELLLGAACLMAANVPDEVLASLRTSINGRYPDAKAGQATSEMIGRFLVMTAAQRPLDDLGFARALLDQVDRMRMPAASLDILQRAMAKHADPDLRILLIHRLFEANLFKELEKQTATLPPRAEGVELQIIALRCIALASLGRKDEARPLAEALAKRTDDPLARAWAAVVRDAYLADAADKPKLIAAIKPALEGQRRNPYLQMHLASLYQAIGEREAAIEAYKQAISGAPLWPLPFMRLADLLVEQREPAQALDAARHAASLTLSPSAMVQLASIWASTVDPAKVHQEPELVKLVELIQQQVPGESQTLPLHIRILAQSGQTPKAVEAIKQALDEKQKPAELTL